MISPVTNGRTASCTRTTSSAAAVAAFSAFSTDCWRCSPPTTSSTFFFRTSLALLSSRSRNPAISLSRRAIQISLTASMAANLRRVWTIIGVPPSSVNCFEGSALFCLPIAPTGIGPMRVPRPAAGMITNTFIAGSKYTSGSQGVQILAHFSRSRSLRLRLGLQKRVREHCRGGRRSWNCRYYRLDHPACPGKGTFIPLAEDHLSSGGLQHRCDRDVDGLADHFPCIVHHHHGAVIEIGHALVVFLTFLQDEYLHDLAGQHDRLERVRELVDVQHLDSLKLRHLVQVEVVGDDLALVNLSQFDQLEIDFADGREIIFHNLDLQRRHFLQPL